MTEMKIALVDDDGRSLCLLDELISAKLGKVAAVDTYCSGEEFLESFTAGKYDLVILDIYMDGQNGVAVAEKIRDTDAEVRLAFCTSSNEFATETYAVGAKDYIQKPITAEKVERLLKKVDMSQIEKNRTVLLPGGTSVRCRDIAWAEYGNHRVELHKRHGDVFSIYASFAEVEGLLAPFGYFYCPMKGILLNFYEVGRISDGTFLMKDGTSLPIARRNKKEALANYDDFKFRVLRMEVENI